VRGRSFRLQASISSGFWATLRRTDTLSHTIRRRAAAVGGPVRGNSRKARDGRDFGQHIRYRSDTPAPAREPGLCTGIIRPASGPRGDCAVKVKPGFALAGLDLDRRFKDEETYQRQLSELQIAMLELEQIYWVERRRGIIAVEGWAGKGGAIRRLTAKLDPRWVKVWPIGKPNPEEQGRHFLWRFWQSLPPPGNIAIFDRTWYGRVLVERVEGLARPKEWRRAHDEINAFEKMLVDDGVRLVKLFLHISEEEQLSRFRERVITPTKRWKMTAEDIRNRVRRRDYLAALDEMFALTSTAAASWYVVPAEYKWFARVAVAQTAVKVLSKGIAMGPPALDTAVVRTANEILDQEEIAALGLSASERPEP
jgi:polyphosphate kinase 2 (PPK2 family)